MFRAPSRYLYGGPAAEDLGYGRFFGEQVPGCRLNAICRCPGANSCLFDRPPPYASVSGFELGPIGVSPEGVSGFPAKGSLRMGGVLSTMDRRRAWVNSRPRSAGQIPGFK
jgi:hypothetical protein